MAMMSMDVDTDPNITIDGQVISPLMQKLAEAQQAASMARTRQARMRAEAPTMNISAYPPGFTMASPPPAAAVQSPAELDADMGMTMAMPAPAPSVYPYQQGITLRRPHLQRAAELSARHKQPPTRLQPLASNSPRC